MKIKEGFITKKLADDYVVIPAEQALVDFKAMITLNETGAFLWENLKNETSQEELTQKLSGEYDVDTKTAETDIKEFISFLNEKGLLE